MCIWSSNSAFDTEGPGIAGAFGASPLTTSAPSATRAVAPPWWRSIQSFQGKRGTLSRLLVVLVGIVRLTCTNAMVGVGRGRSPLDLLPRTCHARPPVTLASLRAAPSRKDESTSFSHRPLRLVQSRLSRRADRPFSPKSHYVSRCSASDAIAAVSMLRKDAPGEASHCS